MNATLSEVSALVNDWHHAPDCMETYAKLHPTTEMQHGDGEESKVGNGKRTKDGV